MPASPARGTPISRRKVANVSLSAVRTTMSRGGTTSRQPMDSKSSRAPSRGRNSLSTMSGTKILIFKRCAAAKHSCANAPSSALGSSTNSLTKALVALSGSISPAATNVARPSSRSALISDCAVTVPAASEDYARSAIGHCAASSGALGQKAAASNPSVRSNVLQTRSLEGGSDFLLVRSGVRIEHDRAAIGNRVVEVIPLIVRYWRACRASASRCLPPVGTELKRLLGRPPRGNAGASGNRR